MTGLAYVRLNLATRSDNSCFTRRLSRTCTSYGCTGLAGLNRAHLAQVCLALKLYKVNIFAYLKISGWGESPSCESLPNRRAALPFLVCLRIFNSITRMKMSIGTRFKCQFSKLGLSRNITSAPGTKFKNVLWAQF